MILKVFFHALAGGYMKSIMYSVLFILMFYIVGIVCEMNGLKDQQAGIYILIGVMMVLGLYIARRNGRE